jgi:hypothetical protein
VRCTSYEKGVRKREKKKALNEREREVLPQEIDAA